jgi:hypothetical protein
MHTVFRVILSRYPQIHLFERVASPEHWDVLYAVESLTNPRLRDEVGDIRLVPREDRVYGEGASWIMAAFAHPPVDGRGGRFNRDFGIYYCAADEAVAIAESSFHRARFLRESRIGKTTQDMRVIRRSSDPCRSMTFGTSRDTPSTIPTTTASHSRSALRCALPRATASTTAA